MAGNKIKRHFDVLVNSTTWDTVQDTNSFTDHELDADTFR